MKWKKPTISQHLTETINIKPHYRWTAFAVHLSLVYYRKASLSASLGDGQHAATPQVSSFRCSPTLLVRETPPKIRQPFTQVPDSQVGWYELFPTAKSFAHSKRTIDDSSRPHETSMSSSYHGEDRDDDDTSFQSSAPAMRKLTKVCFISY
jgi:hypothetical protein